VLLPLRPSERAASYLAGTLRPQARANVPEQRPALVVDRDHARPIRRESGYRGPVALGRQRRSEFSARLNVEQARRPLDAPGGPVEPRGGRGASPAVGTGPGRWAGADWAPRRFAGPHFEDRAGPGCPSARKPLPGRRDSDRLAGIVAAFGLRYVQDRPARQLA